MILGIKKVFQHMTAKIYSKEISKESIKKNRKLNENNWVTFLNKI